MKKSIIFLLSLLCAIFSSQAQIGYQVSLLDAATGQPRADETVSVRIELTDNSGTTICSETKSATSDEFGVLSLTIGNALTFNDVDWAKLPFFISATVDGILLGKSQVLSVPVAEHAKHIGTLTKEILKSKTWNRANPGSDSFSLTFKDSTAHLTWHTTINDKRATFNYDYKTFISGDFVILYTTKNADINPGIMFYTGSVLVDSSGSYWK